MTANGVLVVCILKRTLTEIALNITLMRSYLQELRNE